MRTLARCRVASGFPGGVSCCGVIATVTLSWLVCASTICISAQTKEPSLSSLDRSTIEQMLKETNETVRKGSEELCRCSAAPRFLPITTRGLRPGLNSQ